MLRIPTSQRVALLIDADNIQLSHAEQITKLAHFFGQVSICRAYGDWKKGPLSSFHGHLCDLKIECVQVDRLAKDTTDKQLLIEAGEILGACDADLFMIASGDGDFRLLCERIKHKNRSVIGIGNEGQSSRCLQDSCNQFYYVEQLDKAINELEQRRCAEQPDLKAFAALLFRAFGSMPSDAEGWMNFGLLGNKLRELDPNFKPRFGRQKLSTWLGNLSGLIEINGQMVRVICR